MQVSAFLAMSLDGFIAGVGEDLSWLDPFNVDQVDYGYAELFKNCDSLLMGRNTYEKVSEFSDWPYKDKKVFVCTGRNLTGNPHGVEPLEGRIGDVLAQIARHGFKHLYVDGGQIVSQCINQRLLTNLTLSIAPVLLGGGTPLFSKLQSKTKLALKNSTCYTTGIVQDLYELE